MAIPGLVAASNLADTENKEAVWDNLGNGIDAVILATNSIRNNTMVGAVAGTPGTFPTNWGLANGAALSYSIVGTGTEDEISYIDVRFFGTNILNQEVSLYFEQNGVVPIAQGQTWTHSCYAKIVAGSLAGIGLFDVPGLGGELFIIGENSPFGFSAVEFSSVYFDYSSLTGPLSECRVFHTYTFTNPLVNYALARIDVNFGTSTAIDFTLRVGMPQLERGEYLTPPIATTNAAASALATVPLSIKGDDILELIGARLAATSDFVRIKGLTTLAQPRLTTAAANTA